ncbi:hypothetical protein PFISCL1PPCAC_25588, partial [Pristionchus fissidentatus]
LSIHSDFFSNLFYGPFADKNQEVKEIKDISEPEFVDFLQALHSRRFKFNSVRSTFDILAFADRFLMPTVSRKILPYLKENSLSEDLLEHALIVADRVSDNQEILTWILTQFPSKSKLLEILHTVLPSISATTAQMCLMCLQVLLLQILKYLTRSKNKTFRCIMMIRSIYQKYAGFHLICYDSTRKTIEMEDYFCSEFEKYRTYDQVFARIWSKIPSEYSGVRVGG